MNLVITMAGFGRRFLAAGYTEPKYRIQVRGRSLFSWSLRSLSAFLWPGARVIFVVRASDRAGEFIAAEMAAWPEVRTTLVELTNPTDGQATSAMAASSVWDPAAPLIIYNIDTHVVPGMLRPASAGGAGWIPCFRAAVDYYSFVRVDAHGLAVEVREKVRISDLATVGLYWFDSASRFVRVYRYHYSGERAVESGERFVAPIYNTMIGTGDRVTVTEIPAVAVVALGTPEEVARFAEAG